MAEESYFWAPSGGDSVLNPYSSVIWHLFWRAFLTSFSDDEGYIRSYQDELEVFGISGGNVIVSIGAALVDGSLYELENEKTVSLETPVTDPRIDVIVLQKSWANREIRVGVHQGVENPAPIAPTLTQTSGILWEIPLAEVQIETDRSLTVIDAREACVSPMTLGSHFDGPAIEFIDQVITEDGQTEIVFENLPQHFSHLLLTTTRRSQQAGTASDILTVEFNGVPSANDSRQYFTTDGTVQTAAGTAAININQGLLQNGVNSGYANCDRWIFPDYADGSTCKGLLSINDELASIPLAVTSKELFIYVRENTAIITSLGFDPSVGPFVEGCTYTLWGIR